MREPRVFCAGHGGSGFQARKDLAGTCASLEVQVPLRSWLWLQRKEAGASLLLELSIQAQHAGICLGRLAAARRGLWGGTGDRLQMNKATAVATASRLLPSLGKGAKHSDVGFRNSWLLPEKEQAAGRRLSRA